MGKTSVYFPDGLIEEAKAAGMNVSAVAQEAVRAALLRRWVTPPEPGLVVVAVRVNGSVFRRHPRQGLDSNDWWRVQPSDDGVAWCDLVGMAAEADGVIVEVRL